MIILVGAKIIKASKLCVHTNEYSMYNICRNMYGEAIQVKYFVDAYGVSYFLSLHQKYFLIFIVSTTIHASLEVSLIKGISLPENEFTGVQREIVIAGNNQILIRDDSNAHEIEFANEVNMDSLSDHTLSLSISTYEFVLIVVSKKYISKGFFLMYENMLSTKEHVPSLAEAFSYVEKYQDSVDISALRFIFIIVLRHKLQIENISAEFLDGTLDYELLTAARSDSQVCI